jgi:hypothetical protein
VQDHERQESDRKDDHRDQDLDQRHARLSRHGDCVCMATHFSAGVLTPRLSIERSPSLACRPFAVSVTVNPGGGPPEQRDRSRGRSSR